MPSLPLLYVLTSEVLANQIRKNPAIKGESVSSETLSLTPDLYSGAVSRDLFAEPSEGSRKRPPPSPVKSGNPEAKKAVMAVKNPDKN